MYLFLSVLAIVSIITVYKNSDKILKDYEKLLNKQKNKRKNKKRRKHHGK